MRRSTCTGKASKRESGCLGKRCSRKTSATSGGILETRPYMRARLGLAQCLWRLGKHEETIEHFQDMLRLNPNDNQGVREQLMTILIGLGRNEDAENLYERYEEDIMAVWMYSRALLDFRKHGQSAVADRSLKTALKKNKHVPAYLLEIKKLPTALPDYHSFGDVNEAVLYVRDNKTVWETSPGALEWLAASKK